MSELQQLIAMLRAQPRDLSIGERRARVDATSERYPVAADVRVEPVSARGVAAEWTSTPAASSAGDVILYLHGGGYVLGSLKSHRHFASELGRQAGMRTLALDYRLAPEFPYPSALEDAVEGYRFLLEAGHDPRRIRVVGDSAGGGLSVALLLKLRELGLPQPAGALLFSPWVDMTATADSYRHNAERDPILSREGIEFLAAQYLGPLPRQWALASPVFADLAGIAPLTIFVGDAETLLDDSLTLARVAEQAGVPVHLEVWPEMLHVWPSFHPELAQGRQALARAGGLLRQAVEAARGEDRVQHPT